MPSGLRLTERHLDAQPVIYLSFFCSQLPHIYQLAAVRCSNASLCKLALRLVHHLAIELSEHQLLSRS